MRLNEGLEKIKDGDFCRSGLERVEISRSVKTIGKWAFCECRQLKKVTIPEGSTLKDVEEYAFGGI